MKHAPLFAPATRRVEGFYNASPTVVAAHGREARMVDVREPAEYHGELGHIEGAELVPLATLIEAARRWDRTQPVLLICRSGGRSARAANALLAMDFPHVAHLDGGMLAWRAAGLPVASDATHATHATHAGRGAGAR